MTAIVPATQNTLAAHHAAAVDEASRPVLADNSRKLYGAMLLRFRAWCAEHGYSDAAPVDQRALAAWLLDLAQSGKAVSSIEVALAAVRWTHEQAGLPFARTPALSNVMKRIRREYAAEPKQAAPLKPAMLAEIIADADTSMLGMRDAALLALSYIFALRRSELVGLDLGIAGDGGGVLTLTPDAISITIRRSKTSQEAAQSVTIPREKNPRAVGAIERWLREAKIEPGSPVMRAISPMGTVRPIRLDADTASGAVQRRVGKFFISTGMAKADAFTAAKRYSGHSGRVGFITTAVERGARREDVAKISRHSPQSKMIERYSQSADQLRTAPHNIDGVGL